jgi:hypothetical protein
MKVHRVSASQISTFRACQRKWAFDKVMGIKAPTKPAAAFGSRVHTVLERYYDGGIPPDPSTREGKLASFALPHLPEPHPALQVEDVFVFAFGGVEWTGKVDLQWDPEIVPTDLIFTWPKVDHIISDHKTSKDPETYGLKQETMPDDPQVLMYAMSKFEEIPELETIGCQWTYLVSQGKGQGIPVRTVVQREDVKKRFLPIVKTGHEILAVLDRRLRDANILPPTPSACGDFGGCEYAKMGVCVLDKSEKLDAIFQR